MYSLNIFIFIKTSDTLKNITQESLCQKVKIPTYVIEFKKNEKIYKPNI